ncbi:hypothetical protein [Halosimplex sp. J119]
MHGIGSASATTQLRSVVDCGDDGEDERVGFAGTEDATVGDRYGVATLFCGRVPDRCRSYRLICFPCSADGLAPTSGEAERTESDLVWHGITKPAASEATGQ